MAAPMICRSGRPHRNGLFTIFDDFTRELLHRRIFIQIIDKLGTVGDLRGPRSALSSLSCSQSPRYACVRGKSASDRDGSATAGLVKLRLRGGRGSRPLILQNHVYSRGAMYERSKATDVYMRHYSTRPLVLGIETSCDDTGAAVVDENGHIVGEALVSQTRIHVEMGGIIPNVASELHQQNIENVTQTALKNAQVSLHDIDAIACTVKPGLIQSLEVGASYAKHLAKTSRKPFIPIHHMEAHALTARMIESVPFPFLVLLISGGHCLLALARNVNDFLLIGKGVDDAPGDAFDKTARMLKLKNMPECSGLSGGAAIEHVAKQGDPKAFPLVSVMSRTANCDFSFAGLKEAAKRLVKEEELKYGTGPIDVLPNIADVCANFQYLVLNHLAKRVHRGLLFCELKELLPRENKMLVVSGGVASNHFIRRGLEKVCETFDCQLICPPPKYCTDNGVMIAWNGMEKWKAGIDIVDDPTGIPVEPKCQLGVDIRDQVEGSTLKLKKIKLL